MKYSKNELEVEILFDGEKNNDSEEGGGKWN